MNYCIDCRFVRGFHNTSHPQCVRFEREHRSEDPVLGKMVDWERPFCEHLRVEGGDCGPSGTAWEAKKPPLPLIPLSRFKRWWAS